MLLKTFGWSFAITVLGLGLAGVLWGWQGLAIVGILSILEISLSFDNAVINAGILRKMNAFWQKIFLTVGILVAVFGMRLVFPVVIVAITAKMGPIEAVQLAVNNKAHYEELVTSAHPAIAAFGGIFLLMIFLDFIFEDRDYKWLSWIEKPLARIGKLDTLSIIVALVVLLVSAMTVAPHAAHGGGDKTTTVLLSGIAGLITYLVVGGISGYFEGRLEDEDEEAEDGAEPAAVEKKGGGTGAAVGLAGKAAFFMFLYLEVIDASFSFDGVIGAFAITNDIFEMALGLGIGAMYIRSLTVFLVRKGTLDDYVYLEHGAHYAIGALGVILLVTIRYEINEVVTGLVGIVLIGLSFGSSVLRNRREGKPGAESSAQSEVTSGV
ncbi:DUF475 domain-containing protein [Streptomyces noursei]|uniref:DUF475 domain-containing protein n=1 Tax=Streptomyces noursei TaxID=1971 RepID=A0A401R056_STRNR|nr:DUF475 domain-containing protein [Streptomyces noursei]AKA03726.1 membrane protein [Streptomyces noursei ZPM]EOT02631.1 membrane protein [Streptomyces noursei CCRC 11814]EXU89666.1 membrane protein [Streptomyces noursei PD-1]UWS72117.1 DUF475 domain-containing protein [Streptomyces noursei]GCB91013.1 hypothetical protein SALB_03725 [Streptomyces noursei]